MNTPVNDTMNKPTDKPTGSVLVWDLPVRVFHWSLALCFAIAYVTAESDQWALVHFISGYLFFALIFFRLVWGLVGSRYARFAEFVRSPGVVIGYLRGYFSGGVQRYIGHNPIGAVAILLMLGLGLGIVITGWLNLNGPENEALEEVHELLANGLLAVVVVHVLGVIVSGHKHRENLPRAMVTGYKAGESDAGISTSHGLVALLLVLFLGGFGWALAQGHLPALLDPVKVAAGEHGEHGKGGEGGGSGEGEAHERGGDD